MVNLLTNAITVINNDVELANNMMLKTVIENIQMKASSVSEYELLEDMKLQLTGVNAYIKNLKIDELIKKIDEKLDEKAGDNIHIVVAKMYNEVNIHSEVAKIKESKVYTEPVVKNYVDSMLYEMQYSKNPMFKYIPGFIAILTPYATDETVKESLDMINGYVDKNFAKLIMLEAVHYLEGTPNNFYNEIVRKLKNYIVEGQYSADVINMEMKDFSNIPAVTGMLNALRVFDQSKNPHFDLGAGDGQTSVYNYIGPVIKEGKSLIAFLDDCFLHITPDDITESKDNYKRIIGETDGIKICEFKPEYIYESKQDFYKFAKSFEHLQFHLAENGITKRLKKVKIDFNVNEEGNLDLYLNDDMINDVKNINFTNLFIMEDQMNKQCAVTVFENIDNIFNVEFMKFIVNESRGKISMVINIKDNYYVYDFVDETKRDIYELDGYKLSKFVSDNFNYDVTGLFNIQINDIKGKVKIIEDKKNKITESIKKMEESRKTIDDTLDKDIKEEDRKELEVLREKVEKEILNLQNTFVMLEDEKRKIDTTDVIDDSTKTYTVGDNVKVIESDMNGRIVSADVSNDQYLIFTDDSKTVKKAGSELVGVEQESVTEAEEKEEKEDSTETKDVEEPDVKETEVKEPEVKETEVSESQINEAFDLIQQAMQMLNDPTIVNVGGEMVEKGIALKAMLGGALGLPALAYGTTLVGNLINNFGNVKDAVMALLTAKKGEEVTKENSDQNSDQIPESKEALTDITKIFEGSTEQINESFDLIQHAMQMLNDPTLVNVAGEAIEKGMAIKAMLGGALGLPTLAMSGTILSTLKDKFGDIKDGIKAILMAKQGQDVTAAPEAAPEGKTNEDKVTESSCDDKKKGEEEKKEDVDEGLGDIFKSAEKKVLDFAQSLVKKATEAGKKVGEQWLTNTIRSKFKTKSGEIRRILAKVAPLYKPEDASAEYSIKVVAEGVGHVTDGKSELADTERLENILKSLSISYNSKDITIADEFVEYITGDNIFTFDTSTDVFIYHNKKTNKEYSTDYPLNPSEYKEVKRLVESKEGVGPGGHVADGTGPHGRGEGPGEGRGDGSGLEEDKEGEEKTQVIKEDRNQQIDFIVKTRDDYNVDMLKDLSDADVYKLYLETKESINESLNKHKSRHDLVREAIAKSGQQVEKQ